MSNNWNKLLEQCTNNYSRKTITMSTYSVSKNKESNSTNSDPTNEFCLDESSKNKIVKKGIPLLDYFHFDYKEKDMNGNNLVLSDHTPILFDVSVKEDDDKERSVLIGTWNIGQKGEARMDPKNPEKLLYYNHKLKNLKDEKGKPVNETDEQFRERMMRVGNAITQIFKDYSTLSILFLQEVEEFWISAETKDKISFNFGTSLDKELVYLKGISDLGFVTRKNLVDRINIKPASFYNKIIKDIEDDKYSSFNVDESQKKPLIEQISRTSLLMFDNTFFLNVHLKWFSGYSPVFTNDGLCSKVFPIIEQAFKRDEEYYISWYAIGDFNRYDYSFVPDCFQKSEKEKMMLSMTTTSKISALENNNNEGCKNIEVWSISDKLSFPSFSLSDNEGTTNPYNIDLVLKIIY